MMSKIKVMNVQDLQEGTKKKVVVDNKAVMIANIAGEFYAISDKCPHLGGSLSAGILEGNMITCPLHHASFDVRTGKAEKMPQIAFMKFNVKDAKSIAVFVEGDEVFIEL